MLLLPIMLAGAISISITPTPVPTPGKIITNRAGTVFCSTFHGTIMPFVAAETANNKRLNLMDKELAKYHEWYRPPGDVAQDPNGSPEYNGAQAMAAAHIDRMAAAMYQDIADVEKSLAQSEKQTPNGQNPKLDELRASARSVIELQRQVADRYEEQAGRYLDSIGGFVPMPNAQSKGDPALQSTLDIPQIDADPLAAAQSPSMVKPFSTPGPQAQYGASDAPGSLTSAEIVAQMMHAEIAFLKPALNAADYCQPRRQAAHPQ